MQNNGLKYILKKVDSSRFIVFDKSSEYWLIKNIKTENEFELFYIDGWVQFRCMLYSYGKNFNKKNRLCVLENCNSISDLTVGYRFFLDNDQNLYMTYDYLYNCLSVDGLELMLHQGQYLIDKLIDHFSELENNFLYFNSKLAADIFNSEEILH